MAHALRLAKRGLYSTRPNPRVGCVIAHGPQVVGAGWHRRAGEPHAEVMALRDAGDRAKGATAYVTLEPCSHHGRTPPCADALINAGVREVVAAMYDPNPQVSGQGFERLRAAGIKVRIGLAEDAAERLNRGYVKRMRTGNAWVRVKMAMSLDARTALASGESQWITGPEARRDVQHWRARACAICTGIGTVLADDPRLTVREDELDRPADFAPPGPAPLRVIVDSALRTPPAAGLFALPGQVAIATTRLEDESWETWRERGVLIQTLPSADGHVDLNALVAWLGTLQINEVHTECGPTLAGALLCANVVDELLVYSAPTLLGDGARALMNFAPPADMASRRRLDFLDVRKVGSDIRILAIPK